MYGCVCEMRRLDGISSSVNEFEPAPQVGMDREAWAVLQSLGLQSRTDWAAELNRLRWHVGSGSMTRGRPRPLGIVLATGPPGEPPVSCVMWPVPTREAQAVRSSQAAAHLSGTSHLTFTDTDDLRMLGFCPVCPFTWWPCGWFWFCSLADDCFRSFEVLTQSLS